MFAEYTVNYMFDPQSTPEGMMDDEWAPQEAEVSTARVPRSPGVDSGFGHLCRAWQPARRWWHDFGIFAPDPVFTQ